jgi:hypothetical protein
MLFLRDKKLVIAGNRCPHILLPPERVKNDLNTLCSNNRIDAFNEDRLDWQPELKSRPTMRRSRLLLPGAKGEVSAG